MWNRVILFAAVLFAADPYVANVEHWRAEREARLKSDGGWLTVAGLFWLREGSNKIDVPHSLPFTLRGGKVTAGGRELRADTSDSVRAGDVDLFVIKRGDRYGIRLKDKNSKMRREFSGLKWFPVKPAYRIQARFVASPGRIPIPNVLGQVEELPSPGYAEFRLNGQDLRLYPVLEEPGAKELFYIMRDLTSGHETYGAGRFYYSPLPKDGKVELDFNKAYNPPCAFTPYATCPLPPKQNHLPVRVEAGELKYDHLK